MSNKQWFSDEFNWSLRSYLYHPNKTTKKKLYENAIDLFKRAENEACNLHPGKPIGADEYMPVIFNFVAEAIKDLYLSEERVNMADQLIDEFRLDKKHPETSYVITGLIIALKDKPLIYPQEDSIFSNIFALEEQAESLEKKGQNKEAGALRDAIQGIQYKTLDYFSQSISVRQAQFERYRYDIQQLVNDSLHSPILKPLQQTPKIFTNLLLSISVLGLLYLTATAKKRGTFWLNENTTTVNTLKKLSSSISEPNNVKNTPKI